MEQNACYRNITWNFQDLLPCCCCAIKTNSRTIRSRLSQPTSAEKRRGHEWTASSSLHDTITVNLTLVQCEFHTGKKLPLQESNQLIGFKMPTSGFSRNIWFLIPISRRGKREWSSPHDKLNVKTGPPLADIMIFTTVLASVGCHFLAFFGLVSFF